MGSRFVNRKLPQAGGFMPTASARGVQDVLRSPGQALDAESRTFFEPRFGFDFSSVRIHMDEAASQSADALGARAYAAGRDIVFRQGEYASGSSAGRRLLAHELSHVVQQQEASSSQSGTVRTTGGLGIQDRDDLLSGSRLPVSEPGDVYEQDAGARAEDVLRGSAVSSTGRVGGAPRGVYRQAAGREESKDKPEAKTFSLSWAEMDALLHEQLVLPPLFPARQRGLPSPGRLSLGGGAGGGATPSLTSPSLPPSLTPSGLPPSLTPASPSSPSFSAPGSTPGQQSAGAGPSMPSRLPLFKAGPLDVGARLGFPSAETKDIPGAPPSAVQQSIEQGQRIQQIITGKVPSAWESLDKGKLAEAMWGIAKSIAPDVANKITSGLSSKPGKGPSYQIDAVLFTDFSGEGASFTLKW